MAASIVIIHFSIPTRTSGGGAPSIDGRRRSSTGAAVAIMSVVDPCMMMMPSTMRFEYYGRNVGAT